MKLNDGVYQKGKNRGNTDIIIGTEQDGDKRDFIVGCEGSSKIFENKKINQWLTTREAAEYLRISAKHLFNLTSNGRVRYYKLGRSNRFLLRDLTELLLAQPRGSSYGN